MSAVEPPQKAQKQTEGQTVSGSFRLQASKLMLTYKTHLDKAEYIEWINRKRPTKFCRLAHESGNEELSYEHTHVVVEFVAKPNWKDPKCLDYKSIHPNIKTVGSKVHWKRSIQYLTKEDPENEDLKTQENAVFQIVSSSSSLTEAIEEVCALDPSNWKSTAAIKTLWDHARNPRENLTTDYVPLLAWQKELMAMVLERSPHPRKIFWIYEEVGNSGKSMMARWLAITQKNRWYSTRSMRSERDAATIVGNALKNGWTGHGLVVDLPRHTKREGTDLYSYLETIKDGMITMTKYEGGSLIFPQPHLVIFANWVPHVTSLSLDRWDIRHIQKDNTMVAVSTDEILAQEKACGLDAVFDILNKEQVI